MSGLKGFNNVLVMLLIKVNNSVFCIFTYCGLFHPYFSEIESFIVDHFNSLSIKKKIIASVLTP